MKVKFFFIAAILMVIFCFFSFSETNNTNKNNLLENTIQQRFQLPQGFVREEESKTSFGFFLRNLPLKPLGSNVLYFDGTIKSNRNVYEGVVDLPIGKQDLHQCADAVMRLRADYFYSQKQYDKNILILQMVFELILANGRQVTELQLKVTKPVGLKLQNRLTVIKPIGNT